MLSQEDAEKLMKILKKIKDPDLFVFPDVGGVDLVVTCEKGKNFFPMFIHRGTKNPSKASYNLRHKSKDNPILYRLDINCPPHTNPDDEVIKGAHLHIYREGDNDAWAIPAPPELSKTDIPSEALIDFLRFCNIMNTEALAVGGDLFE